jgi:hypothetical protein
VSSRPLPASVFGVSVRTDALERLAQNPATAVGKRVKSVDGLGARFWIERVIIILVWNIAQPSTVRSILAGIEIMSWPEGENQIGMHDFVLDNIR